MSCVRISNTNNSESILFNDLFKITKNENEANELLAYFRTPEFIKIFGDYTTFHNTENKSNSDISFFQDRLDENNEPKLFFNKRLNKYYFLDKSNEPIFYPYKDQGIRAFFDTNDIKTFAKIAASNFYISHIDFNYETLEFTKKSNTLLRSFLKDFIKTKTSELENSDNPDMIIKSIALTESSKYINEWISEIKDYFSSLKINYQEDEISEEEDSPRVSEESSPDDLMRQESFLKGNKNNVNNNIKLFLSLITSNEINDFNEYDFIPFDDIYNTLNKSLANKVALETEDIFDIYLQTINELSNVKPYFSKLHELLSSGKINNDETFKNQFVSAFNLFKNNFLGSETSINQNGTKNTIIRNLSDVGSKKGAIMGIWEFNFLNKKLTTVGINNLNVETNNKLDNFRSDLKNIKSELDLIPHLNNIKEILNKLGVEFTEKGFNYYINNLKYNEVSLNEKINKLNKTFTDISFGLTNYKDTKEDFFSNQNIFRQMSEAEAFYMSEGSDASVFTTGKTKWVYSLPSYIDLRIEKWKKDPNSLYKFFLSTEYNKGSDWMYFLTASEILDETERLKESTKRLSEIESNIFNSVQLEGDSVNAVDNNELSYTDSFNDYMHKVLNSRKGGKTYHKTALAADKATERQIHFGNDRKEIFNKYTNTRIENGKVTVDSNITKVFYNYFKSDYNRMRYEYEVIQFGEDLLPNYHLDSKNALQSQLFPSLSITVKNGKISLPNLNIKDKEGNDIILYDIDGRPVYENLDIIEEEISQLINNFIIKGIETTYNSLYENSIFELNETGDRVNKTLDESIYNWYVNKSSKEKAPLQIAGDFFVNSVISQVEYSKMFTGDVAYYKNTTDYKKRVPATYTDGLYMRLNPKKNERFFNTSIIKGVVISAQDLEQMKDYLPDEILDKYSNGKINSTDAQAWITPQRWKFILERLGKWNTKYDSVYEKMYQTTPEFTNEELKLVAQPLKGVYFGINDKGVPTFLKYSQAVLVPNVIKGGLEKLFNKMTKDANGDTLPYNDQIHELITQDGIKVGSPIPVVTHNENGDVLNDFTLNKVKLDNSNWKLQQDLPTKGIKSTDLGNQIQKNIFQGLAFNLNEEFELDNINIKGDDLIGYIDDIVGALSNKGKESIINRLGINPQTFKITNQDALYGSLIDQLKTRKDVPANFIKALEAGLSPYGIPGAFQMFQNVFSSIVNKELVKIQTNGGAFIQMSDYGLSKEDAVKKNMIFTPWFNENKLGTYRKVNGRKSLSPAGIFLSGSLIAKHIPNYKKLKSEQLFGTLNEETGKYEGGKIDQEILQNIIGYRIPNQGLPSNDALQIMGILPEEMGDTIIAYTGITTKTGSDFDIDKMYLMIPSFNAIYPQKDRALAKKFIRNRGITFNKLKEILSNIGENVDILSSEDMENIFITNILFSDNDINNEYYTDFNNEYADKKLIADKLEYVHLAKDINGQILPLHEQSKKALQNRLIETYKSVLTNEKVIHDVMNPVDSDIIEKHIKYMFPDKPIADLMSFDAISDLQLKDEFRLGKAGLGQNVNQQVDSVRGSMGNLYFNEYLGWGNDNGSGTKFDNEYSEDLTKDKHKSTVAVLNKYLDYYNSLSNDRNLTLDDIKQLKINTSMMMLINGFVDIAKDPYIVKGNWVTQTNDLGLMLIRAGVHPFKVNAFLGQPILKEYVKFRTNKESKSVNDTGRINEKFKLKKASENIDNNTVSINGISVNKRNLFNKLINITNIKKIGDFPFGDKNEENIILYNTSKNNLFQAVSRQFIKTFKTSISELKDNPVLTQEFKELKDEFIKAYEDVFEVQPRDFSTISLKDLQDDIENNSSNIEIQLAVINKFEQLLKYAKKLAANVSASKMDVDGKGKNINSLIIANNKIKNILDSENTVKGSLQGFNSKFVRKGKDTHQNIVVKNGLNFPYQIMKANPKYFFSANDFTISTFNIISDGLYGQRLQNSELADKLEKNYYSYILSSFPALQTNNQERLELITNLTSELSKIKKELTDNAIINELFIKTSPAQGYSFISMPSIKKSISYQNELTDSWRDLFNTHPEFAEKLVKYSYLISGFNNSINQFHKYIPYEWFNKNRFNSYLKEITFDYSKEVDSNFIDQFHRNNYDDNAVISRVFASQVNPLAAGDSFRTGFISEIKKNSKLPYLTKIVFEQEMQDSYSYYYKLAGTKDNNAYYLRTSTLGYKDNKGNKVIEYNLGHSSNKNFLSIFPVNKINPASINGQLYLDINQDNTIKIDYNPRMIVNKEDNIITESINIVEENLDNSKNITTFVENNNMREYTPENITSLKENEIFVFGSNTEGKHGKGVSELFETNPVFDKQLAQKIQDKLEKLYPEIKLNITNNPVWEQGDNVFNQEEFNNQVNYRLKATEILLSDKAKQIFEKGKKANWDLSKILTELAIPKEQKALLLELGITDREQLALELTSKYSFAVEINIAKQIISGKITREITDNEAEALQYLDAAQLGIPNESKETNSSYYSNMTVPGGTNYTEQEISTPLITPSIKGHAQFATNKGIGWFRSDEKSTGQITNDDYVIVEKDNKFILHYKDVLTGNKIEKIFNSEEEALLASENTGLKEEIKTRRILEVQSDLFQKGRDRKDLHKEYKYEEPYQDVEFDEDGGSVVTNYNKITDITNPTKNQFLQLLNKDSNWVTFFVKSIIQDSAKKGYEKVLFPSGNTASKVEGHTTLEEFKKQKEDRIKELENLGELKSKVLFESGNKYFQVVNEKNEVKFGNYSKSEDAFNKIESINNEINQLKQELERVEGPEGFGALKPIYNFYENTVTNILNKTYGKENVKVITDEYGNTWNEVTINQARDLANVLLQRNEANQIIGQSNVKAGTVLIDAIKQKADTLPHEYAHHYIAWFRDSAIVQEGIKKWGSEEALVQSIGEQVVLQKGEALNWWNNFVKWVMNKFNSLSKLEKQELTQILTDAFLTRQDLGGKQDIQGFKDFIGNKQYSKLTAEEKARTIEEVTKQHRSITALKDLSAKLAWRIGGKVTFENKTDVDWKGSNQGMNNVLNEAYMTPDTPFHEIMAHPIIRAIRDRKHFDGSIDRYNDAMVEFFDKNPDATREQAIDYADKKIGNNQTDLYQNLLKELETGRGKEVLEQVKRDYVNKEKTKKYNTENDADLPDNFRDISEIDNGKYTLEEQQEEAIVTLLGLYAAGKIDKVKDKKLWEYLRDLWNSISDVVKQLLKQDGIQIDKLPITTTLNDLANIMAYGNNKIILPGYKVEYQTPLGNKYDTLEEVNNEIRGLADSNVEVDLSGVKIKQEDEIDTTNFITDINEIKENTFSTPMEDFRKIDGKWYYDYGEFKDYTSKTPILDEIIISNYNSRNDVIENTDDFGGWYSDSQEYKESIDRFIEKNKDYEQAKEIIEQWKKENNIVYDPQEVYSRGQGFYSSIGAYSNLELDLLFQNLLQHIEDNKKANGEFTISAFTKPVDSRLKHIEGTEGKVRFNIFPQSNDIKWAAPTDVYSGSVWDAHEKTSKDKKSEILGVSYTKAPSLRNVNQISPNLADIIDNLSHVHNELGIELTPTNFRIEYDADINYETKKLIDNINKILNDKYGKIVKPEIKKEIGKKVYTAIGEFNQEIGNSIVKEFDTKEEAENWVKQEAIEYEEQMGTPLEVSSYIQQGKQPTQTKDNVSSIENVKSKIVNSNYYSLFKVDDGIWVIQLEDGDFEDIFNTKEEAQIALEKLQPSVKEKEYTSQALTNLKIAALKEVARKYPRSLITSKVVPINGNLIDNGEIQYSKTGKQDQGLKEKEYEVRNINNTTNNQLNLFDFDKDC